MNTMRDEDIRAVITETVAEQERLHRDDIDALVLRTIATILTSFGIEEEDRRELRADFQHLRRWRKSVEQAQSDTTDNLASANNFIRAGYRLYQPHFPGPGRTRYTGASQSGETASERNSRMLPSHCQRCPSGNRP
jgi:hypothetical protein